MKTQRRVSWVEVRDTHIFLQWGHLASVLKRSSIHCSGGGGGRSKRPVKQTAATTRYHHLEIYSYQHQTPNDVMIQYH